jgi:hypothetical protein
MALFIEYFDPKPGVTGDQLAECFGRLKRAWEKQWPSNKDLGLYRRKFGIGDGPLYYSVWELPDIASLEEWDEKWAEADEVRPLEEEFLTLVKGLDGLLIEKVQVD